MTTENIEDVVEHSQGHMKRLPPTGQGFLGYVHGNLRGITIRPSRRKLLTKLNETGSVSYREAYAAGQTAMQIGKAAAVAYIAFELLTL